MIVRFLLLIVFNRSLATAGSAAFAQSGGDRLAAELNALREQQQLLEREIEQYEKSIALLRGSGTEGDDRSPALRALRDQLKRSRQDLMLLGEQEAVLLQQLSPANTAASAAAAAEDKDDPNAEEVARLKSLLNRYYAVEALAAAQTESDTQQDLAQGSTEGGYPADKVRLSGPEGVSAIQDITARLEKEIMAGQRREVDIIFHIEVRREGELMSSSSHSLKSLGKSQFVTKVSLRGGTARVTVRKDTWTVELSGDDASDYLITLNKPRSGTPELHFIPVEELKATHWTELPPWLPYIGAVAPAPAQT